MPYFNKLNSSLSELPHTQGHVQTLPSSQPRTNLIENENNVGDSNTINSTRNNNVYVLRDVKRNSRIGKHMNIAPTTVHPISRLPPPPLRSHVYRRPSRLSQLGSQQNLFASTLKSSQMSGNKLSVATPLLHTHDTSAQSQEANTAAITTPKNTSAAAVLVETGKDNHYRSLQPTPVNNNNSNHNNRVNDSAEKMQNNNWCDVHKLTKNVLPIQDTTHSSSQVIATTTTTTGVKETNHVQREQPVEQKPQSWLAALPPTSRVQMTRIESVLAAQMRATPSDEVLDKTSQIKATQDKASKSDAKYYNQELNKEVVAPKSQGQQAKSELQTIREHMHHLQLCMGTLLQRPVINSEIEADQLAMNALFEHYDLLTYLQHVQNINNSSNTSDYYSSNKDKSSEYGKAKPIQTQVISPQLIRSRLEELDAQVLHRIRQLSHETIHSVTPTLLADKAQYIMERRQEHKAHIVSIDSFMQTSKEQIDLSKEKTDSASVK